MTAGKNDPQYAAALSALESADGNVGLSTAALSGALADAGAGGVHRRGRQVPDQRAGASAHQGRGRLQPTSQAASRKLHAGNAQLAAGIQTAVGAGGELSGGLGQLTSGAGALKPD